MNPPIAYTYEADTHCPDCAVARFGKEPGYPWPPEEAKDREGNPVGAIAPWDDWCNGEEEDVCTLACGTCGYIINTHGPHAAPGVIEGIAQADRHGHPNWSHVFAFGPCTRQD